MLNGAEIYNYKEPNRLLAIIKTHNVESAPIPAILPCLQANNQGGVHKEKS
jgi:hypothetical protein